MENEVKVERSVFINNLLGEVDKVDPEMFPIMEEVGNEDTLIGEMSIYSRKLYALSQFYSREVERIEVEVKYASPEAKEKLKSLMNQHTSKVVVMRNIMFASIREDLGLYGFEHTGMRAGWKVVTRPCNHRSEGADILKRLLGLE